jgi:hypothetical protein
MGNFHARIEHVPLHVRSFCIVHSALSIRSPAVFVTPHCAIMLIDDWGATSTRPAKPRRDDSLNTHVFGCRVC